jgi:hypothetical protein
MRSDIEKVRKLGEEIGYGNMMTLACSLWRNLLINSGGPATGAFVPALIMDIKESEIEGYLKGLEAYDKLVQNVESSKSTLPDFLANAPKKVEVTGEEYLEVFLKFEKQKPVESSSSLHVTEEIYIDEDGTKYHFYYSVSSDITEQPLIEKEING